MVPEFLHLASYGILLGSQFFQTFFNGITAFKALGRPYFGIHQAAIFPVYFSIQSFLPWVVILTSQLLSKTKARPLLSVSPSDPSPPPPSTESNLSTPSGWSPHLTVPTGSISNLDLGLGLGFDDVITTMAFVSLTGLINLIIFRPLTATVVKAKLMQEMKDKKQDTKLSSSPSPSTATSTATSASTSTPSPEYQAFHRQFMIIHATSIFINVCGLLATLCYGVELGMRLE